MKQWFMSHKQGQLWQEDIVKISILHVTYLSHAENIVPLIAVVIQTAKVYAYIKSGEGVVDSLVVSFK